jgi:cytochrome c oxidase subunit 4
MNEEATMIGERAIAPLTYVIVCAVLVLLTFLTVGLSFIPLRGTWHVVFGLTIALCKATLVILFFMHVLISPKLTWIVVLVTAFWLGILLVLTLGDYFSRGMVPYTPGH